VVIRYCIRCIYVMEFGIIGGVAFVRLHYIVHTHLVAKDYPSLTPGIEAGEGGHYSCALEARCPCPLHKFSLLLIFKLLSATSPHTRPFPPGINTVYPKMELECEADEGPIFFSFESNQSNGFLSPAFLSSFRHGKREYNCNEQFFQAEKALWFEDDSGLYEAIVSATDPQEQRAIGKHIEANNPFWSRSWVTAGELWKH
jgi:hypothetical protein